MSQLEIKFRNWIHRQKHPRKKQKDRNKKQESEEKTEEKKDVYIVYRIDDETQTIRLQKVKNGKFSEYGISDATAYRDKYGEFTSEGNITEGSPVQIGTANQEGKLSYIQQSDQVWEQDNVGKFSIDEEKNMIVIGKTKYYYDDSLLVFLDGEQISLDTITGNDKRGLPEWIKRSSRSMSPVVTVSLC